AAGAIIGSAIAGGPPAPAYYGPGPAYYGPPPPRCYWTRGQPVWGDYRGVWGRPRIQVCDWAVWSATSSRSRRPLGAADAFFADPVSAQGHPSVEAGPALHMGEHGSGRPAVDLEAIRLLIGADREPRAHPGLAVDLLGIIALIGQA